MTIRNNFIRIAVLFLAVGLVLSALIITLEPITANAEEDLSRKYTAIQDADISSASSSAKDKVYGKDPVVTSSSSSIRRAILQFNVDGIEELGAIQSVQLVLYVESLSSENFDSLIVKVEEASDANGWSESTVTWNNRKNEYGIDYSIVIDIISKSYDEESNILVIDLDPAILCSDYVTDFMDPNAEQQLITLSYAGVKMNVCSTEGAAQDSSKFAPYLLVNQSFNIKGESNNSSYGTVTPNVSSAITGGSVTYNVVPSDGYYVFEAYLNGVDVMNSLISDGNGGYTLEVIGISEDKTLSVTFIHEGTVSYNISVSDTENGSVTADSYKLMQGQTVRYTIIPDEHYKISKVSVNGTDYTFSVKNGILELTVDSDQTISVIFAEAESKYTLSVTAGEDGIAYFGNNSSDISLTKWSSEWEGSTTVLHVIPNAGYKVDSITVDGVKQTVSGYQLVIIGADVKESRGYVVTFVKETVSDGSIIYPTGDTMLYTSSAETKDTVYGGESTAMVKSASSERLYILSFDVSSITDFSSVTLNIYNNYSGSGWGKYQLGIYALTQAVDDSTTTWNTLSLEGMIYEDEGGVRVSDRGTFVATMESGSLSAKSWMTVDVTGIVNAARISGIKTISFLVINSSIGSTSSSPIPFETKESNLLVDGELVRPHLSVTEQSGGGSLLPAQPKYNVTVNGATGVKLNGEEGNKGIYERYTPVTVDFSDVSADKRISRITVNGIESELVDGKLYLNGYENDVTITVALADIHTVEVECDGQIEVSVESLTLAENESALIQFKVQAGYKATVTINGITYYYVNNSILIEDITGDTVVKITAVEL